MKPEEQPEGAVMSPRRLGEIVGDIQCQDQSELETLLVDLTTAAWPSRFAFAQ